MNKQIFTIRAQLVLLLMTGILAEVKSQTKSFPKLPEAVTSFGASRLGNFLYVYGGHVGQAHVYSKETHSQSFVRINLKSPKKWEELPFNQSLQGMGMASFKGKIYVVGGSQATNKKGEESNLSSLSTVSIYSYISYCHFILMKVVIVLHYETQTSSFIHVSINQ